MGTHVIKMPDIGEGIAQVELVEWFVKVGDMVSEDQVVADVMTDDVGAVGAYIAPVELKGDAVKPGNLREHIRSKGLTIDLLPA